MRLLIDMNLTPRWVQFFNNAGHTCVHWSSLGPSETSDVDICAYARAHGYVLVTNDLDFPQILSYTRASKPSVILLRGQPLTPELRGAALLRGSLIAPMTLKRAPSLRSTGWASHEREFFR